MEPVAAQVTPEAVDNSLFGQMLAGMINHPTACMLVIVLFALGYLYRAREADRAREAVDHRAFFDAMMEKEKEHRETLEKVLPVAENLNQSVTLLAHLIDHKD